MKDKEKALNSALGSTQMEGVTLGSELETMIQQALEAEKRGSSFLYELVKLIQEKKQHESRKK